MSADRQPQDALHHAPEVAVLFDRTTIIESTRALLIHVLLDYEHQRNCSGGLMGPSKFLVTLWLYLKPDPHYYHSTVIKQIYWDMFITHSQDNCTDPWDGIDHRTLLRGQP